MDDTIENNLKYYDMILDFESFEQLIIDKCWPIYFSKNRGYDKYMNSIKNKCVVIGICGNKNRGKSFIFNKLMDIPGSDNYKMLPGFLITTVGISANFPNFKNKNNNNFITLDTAGKENPLLEGKYFKDSENNLTPEKQKNLNKEIIFKARDQKICEVILSNFILEKSNVLIAVVEQLSYVEQTMLQNLTNQLKDIVRKNNNDHTSFYKKLIVIHNLYNLKNIKEIDDFIAKTLLKSFTFKLEKIKGDIFEDVKQGNIYVYRQNINENNLEIVHLIFGDENNKEIKKFFNEPVINYIRNSIIASNSIKFDLIESFKDFLINNSTFLETGKFEKKGLISKIEKTKTGGIYLKNKDKEIKLKGVSIDEKGFCNFHTDMPEPRCYYRIIGYKNKKYLEINIKCYGKIEINDDNISIEPIEESFEIMISGKSKPNIDEQQIESIKGTLKYSDFNVKINVPNKIEDTIIISDISNNESKELRKQNTNTGKVSLYFEIEEQKNQANRRIRTLK